MKSLPTYKLRDIIKGKINHFAREMGSYAAFAHVLEMNTLNRWEFVWFDLSIRHNFVPISVWFFFTLIFSGMN